MLTLLIATFAGTAKWHTLYSRSFRVDPTGPPNYVAHVSWFGKSPSERTGSTMIDLIELGGDGSKRLISSTRDEGDFYVEEVSVHFLPWPKRSKGFQPVFSTPFLVTKENGGQHDHTMVWWFNPKTMRPELKLDVLYGDVSRLNKGRVIENTFSQNVDRKDWPKGVHSNGKRVKRTWSYQFDQSRFVAGEWSRG